MATKERFRKYERGKIAQYGSDHSTWQGYFALALVILFVVVVYIALAISVGQLTPEQIQSVLKLQFFLLIPLNPLRDEKIEEGIDSFFSTRFGKFILSGGCVLILTFVCGICIMSFLMR